MGSFTEKDVFIVTGASSGIGRAVALLLNKESASIVAIARNETRLEETKSLASFPERIFCERKDLTENIGAMSEYIKGLREKYGKFAGLACCAGVLHLKPAKGVEYQEVLDVFNANYFSPLFMVKAFADKRNNMGEKASAVAVASAEAFIKDKGGCVYSASKSALQVSLATFAKEIAASGIRINTVSPSDIATPMTMNEEIRALREGRENMYPKGFGKPEDVAELVVFLLSRKAKWITGQDYIVDCASF